MTDGLVIDDIDFSIVEEDIALEALRQKGIWISPDLHLPKEGVEVLVWYKWYDREADDDCEWYGISYYYNGKWSTRHLRPNYPKVLYWTPLPDLPND